MWTDANVIAVTHHTLKNFCVEKKKILCITVVRGYHTKITVVSDYRTKIIVVTNYRAKITVHYRGGWLSYKTFVMFNYRGQLLCITVVAGYRGKTSLRWKIAPEVSPGFWHDLALTAEYWGWGCKGVTVVFATSWYQFW